MKNRVLISMVICLFLSAAMNVNAGEKNIYQLKIYVIDNEEQELLMDSYLEEALIPALHRHGIKHIGVFKPIAASENTKKQIYVFIPFQNIDQFEKLEEKLRGDKAYQKAGSDYINAAHDSPPYARMEGILLRAFKSMPEYGIPRHSTSPSERIYELRSYQGATEKLYAKKVEMFTDGGESKLFIDLDFQPIFFGEVISGPDMPNLMYFTTFENKASQDMHWDTFRGSPEWERLKADPQYKNTVSKIDKYLLAPTEYSDL